MGLVLVQGPEVEPITTHEAQEFLREDGDDQLFTLSGLIAAARRHAEGFTRRAFITQTWALTLDAFPCRPYRAGRAWHDRYAILLPRAPLQRVVSITYVDGTGATQTLDASAYQVDNTEEPARIVPAYDTQWPESRCVPNAVRVEYVAGYGAAATDVPAEIRQAICFLVAHWYENREPVVTGTVAAKIPLHVESLLWPYRVVEVP